MKHARIGGGCDEHSTLRTVSSIGWRTHGSCPLVNHTDRANISREEHEWLEVELPKLQGDNLAKWVRRTSKGASKAKYPIIGLDGVLTLQRWVCNASKLCGCRAEAMLKRGSDGHLIILAKGIHAHNRFEDSKEDNSSLSREIKVELLKFVESDLTVPKIMHHLEASGFDLGSMKKKQVKNFLNYQRLRRPNSSTLEDFLQWIKKNVCKEGQAMLPDECFVVNYHYNNDPSTTDALKDLMVSFSCPQMIKWMKSCVHENSIRQVTIDATFKIFTNDDHILMASGITGVGRHWFPILYSVVPGESKWTTCFHLDSLWMLLGESANQFFEGIYVLKDAGSGLHAGVHAFFEAKGCVWRQQDCYAHLSRVDGNLQQAFKRYQVPSSTGTLISGLVRRISYTICKDTRDALLAKFEKEFAYHVHFMKWWKSTYGGPFKYWGRCDAPRGYPVSNQGHESNNNTFKKIHMPSRSTQRRLELHKALVPLKRAISSIVREKEREYNGPSSLILDIPLQVWQEVDQLMICTDWSLRQEVGQLVLFPSKEIIEASLEEAKRRTTKEFHNLMIHSSEANREFIEELDLQMHTVLREEAEKFCTIGSLLLPQDTLQEYFSRKSAWVVKGSSCTCNTFLDMNVCKHTVAVKVNTKELCIPSKARQLHRSRFDRLKILYERNRTHKQRAREASNIQRKKRLQEGIAHHLELTSSTPAARDDEPL